MFTIASHDMRHVTRAGATAPSTSTAWVANLAVYVPFTISQPATVYEWFWGNGGGTTPTHNIDFGIYREDFTAVQRLGGIVGPVTASTLLDTTTWTDLVLAAGDYYMAMSSDSTRTYQTSTDAAGLYQASGIVEQTSAYVLPDPMVPVVYTRSFLPFFGLNLSTIER
jgi:hypothetical protein